MYYNYLYILLSIIADLLTIVYSLPMYPLKAVLSEINVELYLFTKIDYSVSFFLVKLSRIQTVSIDLHLLKYKIIHGRLYRWTENSFPFFLYLKPVEISKKCFNTI